MRLLSTHLKGTQDKGIILQPGKGKDIEVYMDSDFAGNLDPKDKKDTDTVISRHRSVIMYTKCPLLQKSQLQTESDLSSTESEFIGL